MECGASFSRSTEQKSKISFTPPRRLSPQPISVNRQGEPAQDGGAQARAGFRPDR
jgi:hypothetical protein